MNIIKNPNMTELPTKNVLKKKTDILINSLK
jgi:hypothetical protein